MNINIILRTFFNKVIMYLVLDLIPKISSPIMSITTQFRFNIP